MKCSTPFGITEVGTRPEPEAWLHSLCAQRLSASQRSARAGGQGDGRRLAGAQRLSASQRSARGAKLPGSRQSTVLNAFRHHRGRHPVTMRVSAFRLRCSTPFGITEVGTLGGLTDSPGASGAQRLSASQRSARRDFPTPRKQSSGAQRLSASQRSARGSLRPSRRALTVLNAFRHHRGRHPSILGNLLRNRRVLNAFRHHRGRHPSASRNNTTGGKCSTPFGITEVGTRVKQVAVDGVDVLNAFRHHRGRHAQSQRPRTRVLDVLNAFRHHRGRHGAVNVMVDGHNTCSTPFGITEVGTCCWRVGIARSMGAQRLSASQRSAHGSDGPP